MSKPFLRNPFKLWIFPLLAVGLLLAGCGDKRQNAQAGAAPQVGVVELVPQSVLTSVDLIGRVSSHATAEVRPQVNGIILKRMFEEGSNVTPGQQLYQIDPSVYQAQYDTALANLKKAETSLANSRRIVDRYKEIIKVNGVSQQEYENATAQLRGTEADVSAAEAAVKSARINLDYTRVFSPVGGRVGISSVTEGALVTAGQITPLVYVQQMDPMYIDLTQSSSEFLRLQRNLKSGAITDAGSNAVEVSLVLEDGLPYEHKAKMLLYDATVNKSTGSITLRAVVNNPDYLLLPGMFVRAVVVEGVTENALLVPLSAVQRSPRGEAMVLVLNAQNVVEQRIIKSDRIYNNAAWIVLPGREGPVGLDPGDRVIVEGVNRVRVGVAAQGYKPGEAPARAAPAPGA